MVYAAKTDRNQKELVKLFRELGAEVAITSGAGNGFPDLVVQYRYPSRTGHSLDTLLVEVKDSEKPPSQRKLTPRQVIFHSIFECHIVECAADVYDLLECNNPDMV